MGWVEQWKRVVDALWPPSDTCAFCGRPAAGGPDRLSLPGVSRTFRIPACSACARELARPRPACSCPGCGREAPAPGRCADCRRRPLSLARVGVYGRYADPLKEAVHRVKFQGDERLLELLSGMLAAVWEDLGPPAGAVVVPVPMDPEKRRIRKWNHAELLARGLGRAVRCRVAPVLVRRSGGRSQSTLGRRERFAAMAEAFDVGDGGPVRGRAVVLVDDVITTGATADACARALLRAGAREVYGAMVAR